MTRSKEIDLSWMSREMLERVILIQLRDIEELERQGAEVDAGWIAWCGGERPVPEDTVVQLKFRDGYAPVIAEPQDMRWSHLGAPGDIIAYRVIKNDGRKHD